MGDNDTRSVSLISSLILLSLQKTPFTQIGCFKMATGFSSAVVAISGYSAVTLIQNTSRVVVLNVLLRPPSFTISVTAQTGFTWFVDKWVTAPFLGSSWVFCGWEAALELFEIQRQVIVHQMEE